MLRNALLLLTVLLVFTFVLGKKFTDNTKKTAVETHGKISETQSKYHIEDYYGKTFGIFKMKKTTALSLISMLLGGILKMITLIPIILFVAVFIGTVSLIGSKVSLIISLILGIRTLLSLLPSSTPKNANAMSEDEWNDIKLLAMKQSQLSQAGLAKKPEMDNFNYMKYMYSQQPLLHYMGKYNRYPADNMLYSENYLMPETVQNNYLPEEIAKPPGVYDIQNRNRGPIHVMENNLTEEQMKMMAASEMAAKANSIMEKQALENPNRRIGVKITKTIVKQDG